jgi:hypothetical protein
MPLHPQHENAIKIMLNIKKKYVNCLLAYMATEIKCFSFEFNVKTFMNFIIVTATNIFLFLYIFIVVFCFMKVFTVIILDAFTSLRKDGIDDSGNEKLFEYISNYIRRMLR